MYTYTYCALYKVNILMYISIFVEPNLHIIFFDTSVEALTSIYVNFFDAVIAKENKRMDDRDRDHINDYGSITNWSHDPCLSV